MAQLTTHALIGAAANLPITAEFPIINYSPFIIPVSGRPVDIQAKISAPAVGEDLPIAILSHGGGPNLWLGSMRGMAPTADFLAGHGFVVVQPTHLESATLGLVQGSNSNSSEDEISFDWRPDDIIQILDHLDLIEEAFPAVKGRLDKSKIAVAGHSYGATTMSIILGANNTDPRTGAVLAPGPDPRVKAGVLFANTGDPTDLSELGRTALPFYGMSFASMTTPALVVCGENDVVPAFTSREDAPSWHADSYYQAPGATDLLWVRGGHHTLGGISGYDAKENTDETPERLALVTRMTLAYLRSKLYDNEEPWAKAKEALGGLKELGSVESKE